MPTPLLPPQHPAAATRVLTLSTVAFTLLFAVWLMLGVLGVTIKAELGLSSVRFAWLAAIAVLSGSLFRLPVGISTDRLGGRVVMTILLVATAIPCFAVSRMHSYGGLRTCALLYGLAGNAFSAGIAWNAAWFERSRQGVALGTFGAGNVGAP
jgi:NNP family nitrate/nitrite transporter-like MFS transporter